MFSLCAFKKYQAIWNCQASAIKGKTLLGLAASVLKPALSFWPRWPILELLAGQSSGPTGMFPKNHAALHEIPGSFQHIYTMSLGQAITMSQFPSTNFTQVCIGSRLVQSELERFDRCVCSSGGQSQLYSSPRSALEPIMLNCSLASPCQTVPDPLVVRHALSIEALQAIS